MTFIITFMLYFMIMLLRKISESLMAWSLSLPRKPLLLSGASQTGKTVVLTEFSKLFHQVIRLDLTTPSDRRVFEKKIAPAAILDALYFLKEKHPGVKRTLLILDKVTACESAFEWFLNAGRLAPDLFITATASTRMETQKTTVSAGDLVEQLFMKPLTFSEFLVSLGDQEVLDFYNQVPVPVSGYEKLLNYFHAYTLIGGMPAIVQHYVNQHGLAGLRPVYEHIMEGFLSEINGAITGKKNRELLAFTLQNAFPYAATRIRFNAFGNSDHRSREMGDAFRWLENNMLLRLIYPSTSIAVPAVEDHNKTPRLQFLDTGLVNYFSGIQKNLYLSRDMNAIFQGQVARQVAGQELMAAATPEHPGLHFWVRQKAQSTAEVDFLVPYENMLIPVEVKSGEPGRLRSLHQFMDMAPHPFAVRLHAGPLHIRQTETIRGKKYFLLSLPYFLAERINEHLRGFIRLVGG